MKRETIERLFKQHYAKMQRVARTLLYDEQESEDVVSDIFESLLNGQTVLLPDTEERYLLTAVRNRCLKRLRHEAVKRAVDYEVSTEVEDDRLTDIVEFAVSHLTEQEQRIFHLRFTDGYRYEEIAVAEGISRVAVWKHLSHVITEIKKQFNPRSL
jgi:RNA polymerase sigma-70 factor (ECF subfamily)